MNDACRRLLRGAAGAAGLLSLALALGCATANSTAPAKDSAPDDIVGQPPSVDSEDYRFAMPAMGPADRALRPPEGAPGEDGTITAEQLRYLRDRGPAVVLAHVETRPHHHEGTFVGFEIVSFSEGARPFAEPDLRVGDVVTHINLVRLEKPDDYMEAWESLEGAPEIRIDFQRGEADEHVLWPVE